MEASGEIRVAAAEDREIARQHAVRGRAAHHDPGLEDEVRRRACREPRPWSGAWCWRPGCAAGRRRRRRRSGATTRSTMCTPNARELLRAASISRPGPAAASRAGAAARRRLRPSTRRTRRQRASAARSCAASSRRERRLAAARAHRAASIPNADSCRAKPPRAGDTRRPPRSLLDRTSYRVGRPRQGPRHRGSASDAGRPCREPEAT